MALILPLAIQKFRLDCFLFLTRMLSSIDLIIKRVVEDMLSYLAANNLKKRSVAGIEAAS